MSYDPKESKLVRHHNPAEGPIGKLVEVQNTNDGDVSFNFQKTLKNIANKGFSNMDPEYKEEKMNKSGKINITDERGGFVEFGDLISGVTYNFQEDSLVIPLDCDIKTKEKKV